MDQSKIDHQKLAQQLLAQAKAEGVELVGPNGLLNQLTANVLRNRTRSRDGRAPRNEKHQFTGRDGGNSRNGRRSKTVLTEIGPPSHRREMRTCSTGRPTPPARWSGTGRSEMLTVDVQTWDRPVPPCVAGAVDRRDTRPDGTVLDLLDTRYEVNGVRTLERIVVAYLPDVTRIVATANDADNTEPGAGGRHSGRIPLTLDELTAIATTRYLAVTAPVIPAVPLMRSCGAFTDGNGPELTQEKVARLDRALEARWASMPDNSDLTLDRPIGSLRLTDFDNDTVCEVVTVESPAGKGRLEIVVASGQPEASPQDEYLNEIDPNRITTVSADGSTVTRGFYAEHGSAYFSIVLPSTQQIIISTPHRGFHRPGDIAQIEYLVSAPELDLSMLSGSSPRARPVRIAAAIARVRPAGPRTSANGLARLRRRKWYSVRLTTLVPNRMCAGLTQPAKSN